MSSHGFSYSARLPEKVAEIFGERERDSAGQFGYGHFGINGKAKPADLYVGLDVAADNAIMFEKLLRRVNRLYTYKDGKDSSSSHHENPGIPAGYTYLFQMVAHDLTRNKSLPRSMGDPVQKNVNGRNRGLMLDTIYGEGPLIDKSLYQAGSGPKDLRCRLRIGLAYPTPRYDSTKDPGGCPYLHRDIPRATQQEKESTDKPRYVDVQIADDRNDDTPMLSQLAALFHLAHNVILDRFPKTLGFPGSEAPREVDLFEAARYLMTKTYWEILKRDALPRILNADVFAAYVASNFTPLVDRRDTEIPAEFSHACCRVGHAMVREAYQFNNFHSMQELTVALKTNSSASPREFPLDQSWVAQWSKFFDLGNHKPMYSRRIGPSYNHRLVSELVFPNADFGKYGAAPEESPGGLLLRDLIRGTIEGTLKLSLLREVVPVELQVKSPFLSKNGDWKEQLARWLQEGFTEFSCKELESLVCDPPLLLWILYEAAEQENGLRLGTLGSLIFGDVILSRMDSKFAPPKFDAGGQTLEQIVFDGQVPASMPELIKFVAKAEDLADARPRFL